MAHISLVWFHRDLRVADNPALIAAVKQGGPLVPIYMWAPEEESAWPPGAASRWWLHQSLTNLDVRLRKRGSRLVIRRGYSLATLQLPMRDTGAQAIFWNHRCEPSLIERDAVILRTLGAYSGASHASQTEEKLWL